MRPETWTTFVSCVESKRRRDRVRIENGHESAAIRLNDSERFARRTECIAVASFSARPLARVRAAVSFQTSVRAVAFAA